MKKIKKSQKKFIRNIIIVIILLVIIEKIVDIAPGYKREKITNEIKLIINEEEITEELKNQLYINENNTIYMSEEDIKNWIDETIYYDENNNQIITTSNTKVANMEIGEKTITVNETEINILDSAIIKNGVRYLPISEMELIYNISVQYIQKNNIVIIDELDKGMIVANISEDTKIKYKPRALSKDIGEIASGTKVYCFYTTSKGWREIRTEDGIIGYVKANKLTNEYILRQDMETNIKAEILNINKDEMFLVDGQETIIKNLSENNEGTQISPYNIWAEISNTTLENEIDVILSDYNYRTKLINNIVNLATIHNVNGININFESIDKDNVDNFKRFIIELAPKLREIGVKTCIELNNDISEKDFQTYVEYIIK